MLWQTERLEQLELLERELGDFDLKALKNFVISAFDKEIQDKTHQKKEKPKLFGFGYGRGRRIRTRDPRFWSGSVHSQSLENTRFFACFNPLSPQTRVSRLCLKFFDALLML